MDRQGGGSSGGVPDSDADPWRDVEDIYEKAMVRAGHGDIDGARVLFQQVIERGSAIPAQRAAYELGRRLAAHDDPVGARDAYLRAAAPGGDDALAVRADFAVAGILRKLGDQASEEAVCRRVAASGDTYFAPRAAYRLGVLLCGRGQTEEGRAAHRQALASRQRFAASRAGVALGRALAREGDQDGATAALRVAVECNDPEFSPRAAYLLGVWLDSWGDADGARQALEIAIASGHADQAPRARLELGRRLWATRELPEARAAFQAVLDSGHAATAPMALAYLGAVLGDLGSDAQADGMLGRAIATGDPEALAFANVILGGRFERAGDLIGAEASYRRASEVPDEPWAQVAQVWLADLLLQRHQRSLLEGARLHGMVAQDVPLAIAPHSDPFPVAPAVLDEAERLYRRAIATGHPYAVHNLGLLLCAAGRFEAAEACFREAVDAGVPQATVTLAKLRVWRDPDADIAALLEPAVQAGDPDAMLLLGMHEFTQERVADGELHLRQAIAAGHPAATAMLVMLLEAEGRVGDAEELLADARARNDTACLQRVEVWRHTWIEMDHLDPEVMRRFVEAEGYTAVSDPVVSNALSALISGTGGRETA